MGRDHSNDRAEVDTETKVNIGKGPTFVDDEGDVKEVKGEGGTDHVMGQENMTNVKAEQPCIVDGNDDNNNSHKAETDCKATIEKGSKFTEDRGVIGEDNGEAGSDHVKCQMDNTGKDQLSIEEPEVSIQCQCKAAFINCRTIPQ